MEEQIRSQLHEALDVEQPDPGLRRRVVAAAHTDQLRRTRNVLERPQLPPLLHRMRGVVAVVATLLVVLLIGITLTGGRVLRDWSAFIQASTPPINQAELHQLETRPLILPSLAVGQDCPVGPTSSIAGYGSTHVSGIGTGSPTNNSWGTYYSAALFVKSGYDGLILIRGRSLRDSNMVVFTGKYAAGPVVGTDKLAASAITQRAELALDAGHPPQAPPLSGFFQPGTSSDHSTWNVRFGLPAGDNGRLGCVGWQVDALGFPTETFVTPPSMFQIAY